MSLNVQPPATQKQNSDGVSDPDFATTVVLVNYNSGKLLGRSLRALFQQRLAPQAIIVVDNASSDGSEMSPELSDPRITLIAAQTNLGFAGANNLALAKVTTKWTALLNPDCFPEPEWLEKLLAATANHPRAASFASRLMDANASRRLDGAGDAYHLSGLFWRRRHQQILTTADLQPRALFSACAAAALYRTAAVTEAGAFDERFFCYGEDVDLGYRLQLLGYDCLYVPDSVAHHVGSAISGARSAFTLFHGHRNLEWVFFKNTPTALLPLLLPLHLAMLVASLAVFWRHGELAIYLSAKKAALKGLPPIWQSRQNVLSRRSRTLWGLLRRFSLYY
ncbi:MAG: glycosyltransferase family 2 protein [Gammaproteobacteria bacterium]|nr:glycosyltransferase family 2 protein [Gammaproteobacteria bacterium]